MATGADLDEGSPDQDEEEYQVEAIRSWRYNLAARRKEFYIKWKNYPEEQNTWEPEEHLHCPKILEEFIDQLTAEQLIFFNCETPDKLTGFQRNATYVGCIGADGPHESDSEESGKEPSKKNKLYILAKFHDSTTGAEELTLDEFFQNKPEEALKFCEERLMYRKDANKFRECTPPNSARSHG